MNVICDDFCLFEWFNTGHVSTKPHNNNKQTRKLETNSKTFHTQASYTKYTFFRDILYITAIVTIKGGRNETAR